MARISLINGEVSVRRGDSGDWVAGVINAPLLTDDYVATGPNSRAEIEFDANNVLRIGANAELRLTQLEYARNQMELAHGVVTFRMLRPSEGNIELDTPSLSVRPSRPGSFRVSVNEAGETQVTARNGDVEVFTPRGSQWVRNGQSLMARGASSDAEFQVVAAGGPDDVGSLVRQPRSYDHPVRQCPQRRARRLRHGGFGYRRHLEQCAGIRQCLASQCGPRLGSLPVRPLGLGRLVWLDLGELRPLGLGALPLRPLVFQQPASAGAGIPV